MTMASYKTKMASSVLLLVLLFGVSVEAFSPIGGRSLSTRTASKNLIPCSSTKRDDEFPTDDSDLSVDWDAEWKKVMEKEKAGEPIERPGKDFYKSEAEITAIRAANKASTEVQKISSKVPSPPSMSSLTGDWRFWIGILALISIGSAVLSAQGPSYTPIAGGDSYYI
ncbi:expressed unknown protein [Seminavis robusta]|uniref:Uncharacterized protein n=1 Tax=Seminavis robusta TaxID=568900 RepID=A0A9N8DZ96_9STRA|nr:expressed unknown protein [Seminavis robusta]|eukprot:Sro464_g148470.1 n/a (168) ;mRNA; f:58108-58686